MAIPTNKSRTRLIVVTAITLLIFAVYAWPWYSFVEPRVAGLPFFYWWVIVWYVISSLLLYSIVKLRIGGEARD